jgi:hypothetical protein
MQAASSTAHSFWMQLKSPLQTGSDLKAHVRA